MKASPRFYKYRPVNAHTEAIIKRNELYFASPADFNDPFDCRVILSYEATTKTKKRVYREFLKRTGLSSTAARTRVAQMFERMSPGDRRRWEKELYDYNMGERDRIGICCLTEIRDCTLMWAHYASGHRGICLEFQATDVPQIDFLSAIHPVSYRDTVPWINAYTTPRHEKLTGSVLTKSRRWEYEREHRILDLQRHGLKVFPRGLLTGLILGACISEGDRRSVLEWVRAHPTPIRLYQATMSPREYRLVIQPVAQM